MAERRELWIVGLREVANKNIPILKFDPATPKHQSSRRPHTHAHTRTRGGRRSREDAELLWRPPRRSFRCSGGKEPQAPTRSALVWSTRRFPRARKTDGNTGGEFTPRKTQTVHPVLPSGFAVKSEDFIINFVG